MVLFWVVNPCGHRLYGGTYCLHLQVLQPNCKTKTDNLTFILNVVTVVAALKVGIVGFSLMIGKQKVKFGMTSSSMKFVPRFMNIRHLIWVSQIQTLWHQKLHLWACDMKHIFMLVWLYSQRTALVIGYVTKCKLLFYKRSYHGRTLDIL